MLKFTKRNVVRLIAHSGGSVAVATTLVGFYLAVLVISILVWLG
jgi:hypothetical protein